MPRVTRQISRVSLGEYDRTSQHSLPFFKNLFSTGYNMLSNAIIEYRIQMGCDVILCDVDEMWCDVMLYGVVWCGVVWRGVVVWCGVVWGGVVWCGVT